MAADSTASILWFRRDLRLHDHPALNAAVEAGDRVVPLFVLDPALLGPSGAPRLAFLLGCLRALDRSLDGRLIVRTGDPVAVIPAVAREVGATGVHISADFNPYGRARDTEVAQRLGDIPLIESGSPYAVSPGRITKGDGDPYRVYTPFFRAWSQHGWRAPAPRPSRIVTVDGLTSEALPEPPDLGEVQLPTPGEEAAARRWADFRDNHLAGYDGDRNRPDLDVTSRLSPYLRWGCVHPRTLLADLDGRAGAGPQTYRKEIAWREFYADVLFHEPASARDHLQPRYAKMRFDAGPRADEKFAAWQEGRTGYPIVDAGMRQLLAQGWMHNRLRMIVASFLIKDLHIGWKEGARHFMAHLVDGDLASNQHGWQWVAGSGTDASPFYRVFNPTKQGRDYDPDGDYVRRFVPELRGVEGAAVHEPWTLPEPPADYPAPIVEHDVERREALERYEAVKA